MANITGPAFLSYTDLYANDTTIPSGLYLGARSYGDGGKMFRYALAGGSDLVKGNLLQERAEDTQFENMAVLAQAIATAGVLQTVPVTNGSTTVAAHDFDGGSLSVYTTPDGGSEYKILGHTTGGSGAALTLTIDRPLQTAWTTSTKVNMKWNPWSKVIQAPATTQTGIPVGVAIYAIPTATYGWVQTHGEAAVLSDGSTFAVGSEVGTPSGTAGCVTVYAAGTTHAKVGSVRQAAASGHWISIFLQID
ncbi:MAG: hypothetical protein KGJ89_05365 [Patescibacteria group bacterium]|nr:hypothetical protein [Patescibacteria group bacterium]MDE2015861.1 hypothetical protein [Patescibacteria group bacterium]MDE2227350.1 hypothetical protein [Patescibacteria group bacterium]